MGATGLTLDDTLADPFINPAKAARIRARGVFGVPYSHSITSNRGGGRTLPLGAFGTIGRYHLVGLAAIQDIEQGSLLRLMRPSTSRNGYLSLSAATAIDSSLAVGASFYGAKLSRIDGIEALYRGSDWLEQDGSLVDVRVGTTKGVLGGVAELLLVANRTDMTYDVQWTEVDRAQNRSIPHREKNGDRTVVVGAHSQFARDIGGGWRGGMHGTLNRMDHPRIPTLRTSDAVIRTVPRDPGTTWAGSYGGGLSRVSGRRLFSVTAAVEPMSSETWGLATIDTTGPGGTVRKGDRTVDNDFYFTNSRLSIGWGRQAIPTDSGMALGFLTGLTRHAIDYRLIQRDHVSGRHRVQRERWTDWAMSFAIQGKAPHIQWSYTFTYACGAGEQCFDLPGYGDKVELVSAPAPGGVIAAPTQSVIGRWEAGRETSHRLTFIVPIR